MMLQRAAGDPWPAGVAADVKSNSIIEFSGPNNPKIDTHNDISVISLDVKSNGIIEIGSPKNRKIDTVNDISVVILKCWCDGGRRVTLGRRAEWRT